MRASTRHGYQTYQTTGPYANSRDGMGWPYGRNGGLSVTSSFPGTRTPLRQKSVHEAGAASFVAAPFAEKTSRTRYPDTVRQPGTPVARVADRALPIVCEAQRSAEARHRCHTSAACCGKSGSGVTNLLRTRAFARSSCKTEQAIQDTKTCGSSFKSQLAQRSFNRSNPEDLHQACCSMDQLERCLHQASAEAGCKEEVSVLVHTLTQTARDLLGDVYNTHCQSDCNGTTRTVSASWINALFLAGCSLLLLRKGVVATS
ncbi:hypothetical protein HPB49_019281 [Dermacentor silvarum]|uniref:Uncharacterized protein n=1 Tax=Dermacentor silvarum TaxID=543639 RepID=A0ACB8C507_DERSI|nr:hypothetical protein HPB49_019281 [Dermacentor silvarum]